MSKIIDYNLKLKILGFLLLLATGYWLLATPVLAHNQGTFWAPGEPIVPCGGLERDGVTPQPECTQCELLHLVRHVIDFVMLAATPILATAFFILAGVYMMLGGA